VSYSLGGVYTDAFVSYIQHQQMVPFFRTGRLAEGILAATELIVNQAMTSGLPASDSPSVSGSGGGGATAFAGIGNGDLIEPGPLPLSVQAGETPEDTLAAFLQAMRRGQSSPDLDIYTTASQGILEQRRMTPAQQQTLLATYAACSAQPSQIGPSADRAVIRYPPAERRCAPWFFSREGAAWKLDLALWPAK
jgi:uncharacterized protein